MLSRNKFHFSLSTFVTGIRLVNLLGSRIDSTVEVRLYGEKSRKSNTNGHE